MKSTILRECLRIAKEHLPKHNQIGHWCHYSFIIQNNKLIEWKTNNNTVPAVHFGYHERLEWDGLPKSHSEFNAYKSARGLLVPNKGFDVINIRLGKNSEPKNSCPCKCCYSFLAAMGAANCWFSTEMGFARLNMT